ncbi:MAG: carbohydrate kinase family protein [Patescibacteria group bacterium]|nr:carbohydrate kinase family protein [Patescibacteria group bacterium]MDE2116670.1 carbohydrate kinase family protein [Patescibacteria group bacterium]
MFSKRIDFLAIGDITTDAFIKLKEASVHCDINNENCQICMNFGDKIPYESVTPVRAVGNSPNAAVSAARLGLYSALATDIGSDQNGRECLESLKRDGVDTRFVAIHKGMETNYHYVLWYEADRTILIKHQEFPYRLPHLGDGTRAPRWVYLSSLGSNSAEYHVEISEWLAQNPDVKLAFQPGTFQMELGAEKLAVLYRRTDIFFCNKEESQRILKTTEEDIKKLMNGLCALGPKTVVVTDGPNGAYAMTDDAAGPVAYFMPPYPDPKPPFERTGAGDAFSSTCAVALALGKPLEEALRWAPINAVAVVQDIGAQRGLLSRAELESWLAKAPSDYAPRKI